MNDATRSYLDANRAYWERGYVAPNVDACVFRFYGRILKPDFGLVGSGETVVDFGCGQGAAVNFFNTQGFDAWGCDISETDIGAAIIRYPHLARKLLVVDPKPARNSFYCVPSNVRIVTAIQALYYLNDVDFSECMDKLYSTMLPGAVFFATMMGEQADEFFTNSYPASDGLREVRFKNDRLDVRDYFMSFIRDEEQLKQKFKMFRPIHIGHYGMKLRNDEGDAYHFTFCGIK